MNIPILRCVSKNMYKSGETYFPDTSIVRLIPKCILCETLRFGVRQLGTASNKRVNQSTSTSNKRTNQSTSLAAPRKASVLSVNVLYNLPFSATCISYSHYISLDFLFSCSTIPLVIRHWFLRFVLPVGNMLSSDSPVMTIILCIITLVLGLPVATAAIVFESAWVPSIILGTKIIDTGPGQTTTLRFDLLSGPNDAVSAGAYISIISAIIVIIGFVLSRHITYHNVYGWLILGPSLLNFFSQIGSCAASYIFRNKYPEATSNTDVRFIDGAYNTDGRLFTKESWACTMNTFYREREGKWADKACSNFVGSETLDAAQG